MIWQVKLQPKAEADIEAACDGYDERRPGLGAEFLACVCEALSTLEENPTRYAVYYRGLRRLRTRRFPYKLFYLVEAGANVHVLRVLHGHRDHRKALCRD